MIKNFFKKINFSAKDQILKKNIFYINVSFYWKIILIFNFIFFVSILVFSFFVFKNVSFVLNNPLNEEITFNVLKEEEVKKIVQNLVEKENKFNQIKISEDLVLDPSL